MENDLIGGSVKFLYLCTIGQIVWVWFKVFCVRNVRPSLKTMFWVMSALAPLYSAFALMYVLSVAYHSWIGYLGWTAINMLFIATDGMLIKHLTRDINNDRT